MLNEDGVVQIGIVKAPKEKNNFNVADCAKDKASIEIVVWIAEAIIDKDQGDIN